VNEVGSVKKEEKKREKTRQSTPQTEEERIFYLIMGHWVTKGLFSLEGKNWRSGQGKRGGKRQEGVRKTVQES